MMEESKKTVETGAGMVANGVVHCPNCGTAVLIAPTASPLALIAVLAILAFFFLALILILRTT